MDAILIDGCAMLHSAIHWPKGGKIEDFLEGIQFYVSSCLENADVYLIFDRYKDFSIKSDTRQERLDQFRRHHILNKTSPLPSKDIALRVTETKTQLIEMIKTHLLQNLPYSTKKFVFTSKKDIPSQLHCGKLSDRQDLTTKQEEADVIIPHHVLDAIKEGKKSIKESCEDTDVFVLLCHSYEAMKWKVDVYMDGFQSGKTIISIKDSVEKHKDTIGQMLSLHALTGCDSVPMMFGVGKKKALSVIKRIPILTLGDEIAGEDDCVNECKKFVAACYNGKSTNSSDNR